MIYSVKILKASDFLPITLQEVKLFLKVDGNEEDELLKHLIIAASIKCELYIGKALLTKEIEVIYHQTYNIVLKLPIKPLQKVQQVKIIYNAPIAAGDLEQQSIILEPKYYSVETNKIILINGIFANKISVIYTAGYGDIPIFIPADLTATLLRHVSYLYENRNITAEFNMEQYNDYRLFKL